MKYWQCSVCKYIHQGDEPPEKCPICGVDASKFVEIDEADIPKQKIKRRPPAADDEKPKPPLGETKEEAPKAAEPKGFRQTVESLLVKHHAHPVSVHTPNGVLPMAVILYILAWIFNSDFLAKTAMVSQIFVILSLPVVIYTGVLEWRSKYNAAFTPIFKIKILAASLTSVTCLISFFWYLLDPAILHASAAWVFILINLLMLSFAGIAGHIGGKLVFKD